MANGIVRNVEVNVREGSNALKDEFALLKSGRASLQIEFSGNGFQQFQSLQSDIAAMRTSFQNIESVLGTISTKVTNVYSQISQGANQATQAVNNLNQAQQNLGRSSSASSQFAKQLQQSRRQIDSAAEFITRKGVNASSLSSNNTAVDSILRRIEQSQNRIINDPVKQATAIARAEPVIRKLERKIDAVPIDEAFAGLFGGDDARRRVRLDRARELAAANPGVPNLEQRLSDRATTGQLGRIVDLNRLTKPEVATQIAFGAIFGGQSAVGRVAGAGAAALGGAFAGAPGALFASTVQQGVAGLIEPIQKAFDEKQAAFKSAGDSYSEAILAVSTNIDRATQLINGSGERLGPERIAEQIQFRTSQAEDIQRLAQPQLNALGIDGSTEALFVKGITSGLRTRGLAPDAETVATLGRAFAGTALVNGIPLTQKILQRDIPEVASGNARARNTDLGQVIDRRVFEKLTQAKTNEELREAVKPLQGVADFFAKSDNIAAIEGRISGAQERINTIGGQAQQIFRKPALQAQERLLNSDAVRLLNKGVGVAGGLAEAGAIGSSTTPTAVLSDIAGIISNPIKFLGDAAKNFKSESDSFINAFKLAGKTLISSSTEISRTAKPKGIQEAPDPEADFANRISQLGLDSKKTAFGENFSAFASLAGVNSLIKDFGKLPQTAKNLPFLLSEKADFQQQVASLRAQSFATGTDSGKLSQLDFLRGANREQIGTRQAELQSIQASLQTTKNANEVARLKGLELQTEAQISALKAKELDYATQQAQIEAARASRQLGALGSTFSPSNAFGAAALPAKQAPILQRLLESQRRTGATDEELDATRNEILLNREASVRAPLRRFDDRLLGVNADNFAGRQLASDITLQKLRGTRDSNNRLIAEYQAKIASGEGGDLERERIAELQNQNRSGLVAEAREGNRRELFPAQQQQSQAELSLAISQSSRLIADEALKRQLLNAQLDASQKALQNFQANLDAANAGEKSSFARKVRSLHDRGIITTGPFGNLSDQELQDLQDRADVEDVNAQAKKLGFGNVATKSTNILDLLSVKGQSASDQKVQELSLKTQTKSLGDELTDLADTFRKKAAELSQIVIGKKQELNGKAEPGQISGGGSGGGGGGGSGSGGGGSSIFSSNFGSSTLPDSFPYIPSVTNPNGIPYANALFGGLTARYDEVPQATSASIPQSQQVPELTRKSAGSSTPQNVTATLDQSAINTFNAAVSAMQAAASSMNAVANKFK
jgi:hypothetical protein